MSGWVRLSRRIRVISRVNAAESSTSSFASASGLSRTMAMSISPPSLWIIVGRPACISARIATALFSHKVRSHSSTPLFLWPAPLSFDWSPHLRFTCGPAGNRTTTGSLSRPTNYSTGTPFPFLHTSLCDRVSVCSGAFSSWCP